MLIIRKPQMDALKRHMLTQFESNMVSHLRSTFPARTKSLEVEAIRNLIRQGAIRAGRYGITSERDIRRYVEYMVMYGADFDVAPTTSWAGKILNDATLSVSQKLERLDDYDTFVFKGRR
jgi:hypothetical protein